MFTGRKWSVALQSAATRCRQRATHCTFNPVAFHVANVYRSDLVPKSDIVWLVPTTTTVILIAKLYYCYRKKLFLHNFLQCDCLMVHISVCTSRHSWSTKIWFEPCFTKLVERWGFLKHINHALCYSKTCAFAAESPPTLKFMNRLYQHIEYFKHTPADCVGLSVNVAIKRFSCYILMHAFMESLHAATEPIIASLC